ncbi:MAG: glycosyltransferase family 2 protein [Stenomitos rutilans HA7619-LM2]|jgi:GT2 family glycosyltransferase|nr:glycosyltransferase family 2 protein [Stenomitos rutilans HA7619-LM2]
MSDSNPILFVSKKLGKLVKVWQERNTLGLLKFLYRRSLEKVRGRVSYQKWIARDRLTKQDIVAAQRAIEQWSLRPTFSIIMPVYNVEARWLEKAIQSVQNQLYPDWELCIADDASPKPHIKRILTHYSKSDARIKVAFRPENGQIAAASNTALELATGDYIALLDHDDELAINALFENAKLINEHPDADFIYSDEDKMDTRGRRIDPFFKPDWSPDYFHACMYTCHLGVYRTSLVRAIRGFRAGFDGAQDYDLVLRVAEKTKHIYHIPKILYHWRVISASVTAGGEQAKPWAYDAARKSLEEMLTRSAYPGVVETVPDRPGFWRVRRHIIGEPLISIIIPSAGKGTTTSEGSFIAVENCLRSLQERSTYRKFEVVLVDGYDIPDDTIARVMPPSEDAADRAIRLVRCREPFNFAHRINQGAAHAKGEFLLLLNDDTEVITPDWLESMLEFAQQEDVGAVGAKLLYPDGKIQHGGVMVLDGNPGHAYHGFDRDHPGYYCSNLVNRNYLAVTAACLMLRRSVFQQVGGMDEIFPLNYNDVDLCLKVHQAGYRNVVVPYAQLIHYESLSRQPGLQPKEWETLNQKWQDYFKQLNGDPYYNPNLSHRAVTFELW